MNGALLSQYKIIIIYTFISNVKLGYKNIEKQQRPLENGLLNDYNTVSYYRLTEKHFVRKRYI